MNRTMTYRPRGSEVEAIQVTPTNVRNVAKWCNGRVVEESSEQKKSLAIIIPTFDGNMRASEGDWVVKDSDGEVTQYNDTYFTENYVRA